MNQTIQKIPFIRLSVALALGIVTGTLLFIPQIIILILLGFFLFILLLLHQKYSYRLTTLFGLLVHLFFIFLGILACQRANKEPIFFEKGKFIATILEAPVEKTNSCKSVVEICSFFRNDSLFKTKERTIVYFAKNEKAKSLIPGDIIAFHRTPQIIQNKNNPFEFDYKKHLKRKKIFRQLYLTENDWIKTENKTYFSFQVQAELIRDKLLLLYKNQNFDTTGLEILSALTLGYKRELEPETKRVFSAAGAMHVLAVSGLHVGIIIWIFSILFGFLRKQKAGRFVFVVSSVFLVWFFAFITGFSPSVQRAAIMFSIYIIGENLKRPANIYNSLAASAFLLLLINPNNLFEVGFQLSYSAVFGIVFLHPYLSRLIVTENKLVLFFRDLIIISIAAQIATFPITSYYFGMFPSYFWITNIFIIPAAMLLIPSGILLLAFAKVPLLSTALSWFLNEVLNLLYFLLKEIEDLPLSTLHFSISSFQFVLLITLLLTLFIFLKTSENRPLKLGLISIVILVLSLTIDKVNKLKRKEIIVYNDIDNAIIQLISGSKNYIISEKKIEENNFSIQLFTKTSHQLRLKKPVLLTQSTTYSDDRLRIKNEIIFFEGKSILLNSLTPECIAHFKPDYIVNPKRLNKIDPKILQNSQIIISHQYSVKNASPTLKIYQTSKQGAFFKIW